MHKKKREFHPLMKEEILEEGIFAKSLIIHTYIYIYHIYIYIYICYIESIVIKENLFIERHPL